jgi:hypothetical protein
MKTKNRIEELTQKEPKPFSAPIHWLEDYQDLKNLDIKNNLQLMKAVVDVLSVVLPNDNQMNEFTTFQQESEKKEIFMQYLNKAKDIVRFIFLDILTIKHKNRNDELAILERKYANTKSDLILNVSDDEKVHLAQKSSVESKYTRKNETLKQRLQKAVNNITATEKKFHDTSMDLFGRKNVMALSTKKNKWEFWSQAIILMVISLIAMIVETPLNQPLFWKIMSYNMSYFPAIAVCLLLLFIMHWIGHQLNLAIHRRNKRKWLWVCIPVILLVGVYVALTIVMRERMDKEMALIAEHGITYSSGLMQALSFQSIISILKEDLVMFFLAYAIYLVPIILELWLGSPVTRTEKTIMKALNQNVFEARSEANNLEKQISLLEDELNAELEQVDDNYSRYFTTFKNNPYKANLDKLESQISQTKEEIQKIEDSIRTMKNVVWISAIDAPLRGDDKSTKAFFMEFQQIFKTKNLRDEIFSL